MFLAAAPVESQLFLLFPLASSLIYVAGALSLKRASQAGAGIWRTAFVSNVTTAVLFSPMALFPIFMPSTAGPMPLWQPALIALAFVVGQACTMYALNKGDVSIATPVVGTKVIFVAFFATLILGNRLAWPVWMSAAMSALGIGVLNRGGSGGKKNVGRTVVSSLAAAACYAIFDVMVRRWSPAWGSGRLLPLMFGIGAVYSLAMVPFFDGPSLRISREAAVPLLVGSALIALQSMLLITTITMVDRVTEINVVYNSRGLWSVVAVWLVGHWWGNTEMSAGGSKLAWRLCGAGLLLLAILMSVYSAHIERWLGGVA
ncbi:DMT family transporter [Humisphaera borealis]|uniref:DMT family transporter n=1 Tax=Humisphaera borealis TaxID=2807512 RepID=A0A7M2WPK5_9BACT|nr:DMT family transporter [Humisphaera borealis]QOV87339.1 DMT family transporter [Humisphaera borealis]